MRLRDLGLKSLQTRLLLGALLWISLGLIGSGLAISHMLREHIATQFRHELEDHLTELIGLTSVGPDGRVSILRPVSDPRFANPGSGYYWEIQRTGRPVLRSDSLDGHDLRGPVLTGLQVARRTDFVGSPAARLDFTVAGDASELTHVMARFQEVLAWALGLIAVGLGAAAAAQVAFGLRPLRRLRFELGAVRDGRAPTLSDDFPAEVRPLVADLNALLGSQADMVVRARTQAGNLGHALRTPLAILTAEARTLAAKGQTEAAEAILAECRAISRQVDHQIARTRAAAARAGAGAHVRPFEEIEPILSAMRKLWAGRERVFLNDAPADLVIAIDRDDLGEILGNLIDNAGKWAASTVRVSAERLEGAAMLMVEDDGPGVAPEHRRSVFELGARIESDKPGSGLGLAIVKDLVGLYGGEVTLDESPLGGLRARVTLPDHD